MGCRSSRVSPHLGAKASVKELVKALGGSKADRKERRRRLLASCDEHSGVTPLIACCAHRGGGAGPDGWLGFLAVCLRVAGDDGTFVNAYVGHGPPGAGKADAVALRAVRGVEISDDSGSDDGVTAAAAEVDGDDLHTEDGMDDDDAGVADADRDEPDGPGGQLKVKRTRAIKAKAPAKRRQDWDHGDSYAGVPHRSTAIDVLVTYNADTPYDAASDAQRFVAVATLLAHGADVTHRVYNNALDQEALPERLSDRHEVNGNHPSIMALLRRAEESGDPIGSVTDAFRDAPEMLTTAPGWNIVSRLPQMETVVMAAEGQKITRGGKPRLVPDSGFGKHWHTLKVKEYLASEDAAALGRFVRRVPDKPARRQLMTEVRDGEGNNVVMLACKRGNFDMLHVFAQEAADWIEATPGTGGGVEADALFALVHFRNATAEVDAAHPAARPHRAVTRLLGAIVLLAYGAEVGPETTGRTLSTLKVAEEFSGGFPTEIAILVALLERAEEVGGREAVEELIKNELSRLVDYRDWSRVAELPMFATMVTGSTGGGVGSGSKLSASLDSMLYASRR